MRYLLLVSIFLSTGCASAYKGVRTTVANNCITAFKPNFSRIVYSTQVEVVGRHLSGLLIIKTMPDRSVRMVFSNEAGFKFFDFEFKEDAFKVYHIVEQMNRQSVIKTLRKDFELILMQHIRQQPLVFTKEDGKYYEFVRGKDHYYYITDNNCEKLLRMERGSRRKKVTEAYWGGYTNNIPDTIGIRHSNFNFTIALKQLEEDAAE